MIKYIAFFRGIGSGNPNMRKDKLCAAFVEIGFSNVRSVISSGNILVLLYLLSSMASTTVPPWLREV